MHFSTHSNLWQCLIVSLLWPGHSCKLNRGLDGLFQVSKLLARWKPVSRFFVFICFICQNLFCYIMSRALAGIGTGDSSTEVFWLSAFCSHCKNFSQVVQLTKCWQFQYLFSYSQCISARFLFFQEISSSSTGFLQGNVIGLSLSWPLSRYATHTTLE